MPKTPATTAHFDVAGLLRAVAEQDFGLRVSTNNPRGFRRIMYQGMREGLGPRAYVYQCPRSPKAFLLLRQRFSGLDPLPEPTETEEPA